MKKTIRTLLALMLVLGLVLGMAAVAEAKTATRLTMSRRALTMDWGTEFTLSVVTTPTSASDRKLIAWDEGDDPYGVITVTPDVVDPRKAKVVVRGAGPDEPYPLGFVTVTASTPSGKNAKCVIKIDKVDVAKIEVTPSARTVYFTKAAPYATYPMGKPKFTPSVAGDRTSYSWSSDNETVAEVDASGLVTFKAEGRAKITATYTAPGKELSDSCIFTVKPARVKSVSIKEDDGTTADVLYYGEGDTFTLSAALTSAVSGKRPSYEEVTWTSDKPSIVEVGTSDGGDCTFTGKASGIATITATADTGRYAKSASCTVYVRDISPTTLTITAGGDCVLGGDPRTTGITARSTQREYEKLVVGNSVYPFEKIAALFSDRGGSTNLSIINLEVCLTSTGGSNPSTLRKFLFRGSPKNAQALAAGAGIDIANIANNHTADFGPNAFGHTAKNVATYGGDALASGYNRYNTGATPAVTVKDVNGKKIGFYGVQANQVPVSVLTNRIKKYRKDYNLDMMVVTIHWTGQTEYVRPVTSTMKTYARAAINAGADLVIGHHRHEMSGFEKYKGKYILYDMGSLVTGGGGGQFTCAVQIDFKISSQFTETASESGVDQIRIYPLCTTSDARYAWNSKKQDYSTKQSNNWQPVPAEEAIHHFDKDSGDPVLDKTMTTTLVDDLIKVINAYSPTGPDGSRFRAESYITPYYPR